MTAIFAMQVTVEPKDEVDGRPGYVPDAATIGSELFDLVADRTKHGDEYPFRVTTLTINPEPVTDQGPPPPSSRAGGGYLVDIEEGP